MSSTFLVFIKPIVFVSFLLLFFLWQKSSPHRVPSLERPRTRLLNFALGGINLALVSLLTGSFLLPWVEAFPWTEVIFALLLMDFVAYLLHRLFHRSTFLFRFHSLHHSDIDMEMGTALRFHGIEVLTGTGLRLLIAFALGLSLQSLLVFETIFLFMNLMQHSSLKIPQGLSRRLGALFITPALHRKHHSVIHFEMNSNYGTIFSFWDRLFRSRTVGDEDAHFEMGLVKTPPPRNLMACVLWPWSIASRRLK